MRKDEPTPKSEKPPCPQWLSPEGKKFWKEISIVVYDMGVLTKPDRFQLALLCDQAAFYRKASEDRDMVACTKILPSLMKLCAKFGLSPSDRVGLVVPDKPKVSDKSRFFGGKG